MNRKNFLIIICYASIFLLSAGCNTSAESDVEPPSPISDQATPSTNPSDSQIEAAESTTPGEKTLLIYDDDGSRDGMAALLYLLSIPEISIGAVNISYGEAHPEQYIQLIGNALESVGVLDIPLGAGQDAPLAGGNPFPDWLRQLGENFWDYQLLKTNKVYPYQNAPELMVSIINNETKPVTIFLSGTFTNLAQALRIDPAIKEKIAAVYFMGGAVYVPGNITNLSPDSSNKVAEWNIIADPQAAKEVFAAGLNMYMIPLDATNQVIHTKEETLSWHEGDKKAIFVADLYDIMFDDYGLATVEIFDQTAAVIMVQPDLCGFEFLSLDVVTDDGDTLGQTVVVPNGEPNIHVCLEPNVAQIKQHLDEIYSIPSNPQGTPSQPSSGPQEETAPAQSESDDPVQPAAGPPNTIFFNANVLTMDENLPNAQAVAIQDEFIVAVGTDDEILGFAGADTKLIDLNGSTMTPGFIDSHTHRTTQRGKWGFSTIEESTLEWVSQGWTGLVELAVDSDQIKEMIAADAAGELHTRINAYLVVNTFGGDPLGDWYQQYEPHQQFSPYLRIAGLKIYIGFDSGRVQLWTQNDLNEFIRERQLEGWHVTVKAVGMQSHELALNAYEYAMGDDLNGDYRYRIEHSVGSSDEQVARMADLGIIASIQTSFPAQIWGWEDIRNLSEEQGFDNMFQWHNYLDSGMMMVASPLNPPQLGTPEGNEEYLNDSHVSVMGLLYRSVTQISPGNTPPESWMLERAALSVNELLPMLTINGAYGTFEEDIKGSIEPGKVADLVVLSDDPHDISAEDMMDVQVLQTMVGGNSVYCAEGHQQFCIGVQAKQEAGFADAVGTWYAVDSDGSAMTLEITEQPDGDFYMTYIDDGARACITEGDGNAPTGVVATGSGKADGLLLEISEAACKCDNGQKEFTFLISFTYELEFDVVSDNTGVNWERR